MKNKIAKPDYLGHRQRIREKYLKSGFGNWHDYEILELILTYAISRKDTKPIAKALLKKFKSVRGVFDAEIEALSTVNGMGTNAATLINLFREAVPLYLLENLLEQENIISSPKAVYDYLQASLRGAKDEIFKVIFLNTANRPVKVETIHVGTVNKAVVYPRKVVEHALGNKAVSVILAHNHPGGSLTASEDDKNITQVLIKALGTVDVNVLDHIIIGLEGYFSFKEHRLI
ncbi:MAG: DNA repair protein RadC [bacterium]|nr:DNA repair protein RadC [bacterium]